MILRSSGVSGPGLRRMLAGIPIFPMSWKSAPSSRFLSERESKPIIVPTFSAVSVIQRVCDDVYSSFASRALASASTVETNVASRLSKLLAFVWGPPDDVSPREIADLAAQLKIELKSPEHVASVAKVDRVRHRVHAGGGGDLRRQRPRGVRVQYRDPREERDVRKLELHLRVVVLDDRRDRHLRSGAGGRGDARQRRDRQRRSHPVVLARIGDWFFGFGKAVSFTSFFALRFFFLFVQFFLGLLWWATVEARDIADTSLGKDPIRHQGSANRCAWSYFTSKTTILHSGRRCSDLSLHHSRYLRKLDTDLLGKSASGSFGRNVCRKWK